MGGNDWRAFLYEIPGAVCERGSGEATLKRRRMEGRAGAEQGPGIASRDGIIGMMRPDHIGFKWLVERDILDYFGRSCGPESTNVKHRFFLDGYQSR